MNLDQLADEAKQRISYFINRSAGQHVRAMRAGWQKVEQVPPGRITLKHLPSRKFEIEFFGDEPDEPSEPMKLAEKFTSFVLSLVVAYSVYAAGEFFCRIFFK